MVMGSYEGGRTWVQSQDLIVGEGQTEETHSEKGEMSNWRGLILRVSWTVDHGV